MAEQIAFSIADKLLMKLGSAAFQEIGLMRGVRDDLTTLAETLSSIKAVLLDAEEQKERNHAVQNWVSRLNDVVYDADDLLDDFEIEGLRRKADERGRFEGQVRDFFSSSNHIAFRSEMGHRIKGIRKRLDEIANDISKFNFITRVPTDVPMGNRGRETHSYVLTPEIIGRDEDKEEMIKLLLESGNDENLSLVGIVGIGGLGKTTLAQLVYNDEKVIKYFEPRMWVCVSDDFNVKILVRNIIKSATDRDVGELELDQLKNRLHENLSEKRYLLVLDDVWNEDFENWNQLRILMSIGAKGSKIIVTTRSTRVTSIMGIDFPHVLEGLKYNDSWALFKNLAFGEEQQKASPNLLEIGEEITKMCNGVPLVIRTLGRILYSKTEETQWLSIRNNKNLMSLRDGNNILSVLKLSYDNLPSHLKQCFTYCALFPKDYKIERKLLIQLWMAQGYIQTLDGNEHLEDIGNQYFEELSSQSLFQEIEKDGYNNIISCKMHDLIHDLVQSLVKFEIISLIDDVKNISEKTRHVSFLEQNREMEDLKGKSIRTFFMPSQGYFYHRFRPYVNPMVNTLILNCKYLRVLDLRGWSQLRRLPMMGITPIYMPMPVPEKLPKSLIKLGHLRYLDLSYGKFEVLPSGFTSLQNLQTLKLLRCASLKEWPRDIRKLINLRHLEIDQCNQLTYMPSGLGELTKLHTLPFFFAECGGLSELKCLNNLRGSLCLKNLRGVNGGESKEANLKEKHYLQSLGLGWNKHWEASVSNGDGELVMEGLQPHPNLKELYIDGYTCVRFPSWMSSIMPSLQRLSLTNLDALEYVLENSASTEPFVPSLKTLNLSCLYNFKGWCRRWEIAGEQAPSFPSLSHLQIDGCRKLTTFQLLSSPRLSKLDIQNCNRLESLQLPSCPSLSQLKIDGCPQLTTFQLLSSSSLSKLDIQNCSSLESLQLPSCPSVSQIKITRCDKLTTFQLVLSPRLLKLEIENCSSLESLQLPSLPCLEELNLGGVREQIVWQIILVSSSLKSLLIKGINDLVTLPDDPLQHLTSLKSLKIQDCDGLMSLFQGIQHLGALEELQIYNCKQLKFSDREDDDGGSLFQGLRSLRQLFIRLIPKLVCLPKGLQHVTTMETLSIGECYYFITLPDWIGNLTSLSKLKIWGCPRFKLEDWSKIAHIPTTDIC